MGEADDRGNGSSSDDEDSFDHGEDGGEDHNGDDQEQTEANSDSEAPPTDVVGIAHWNPDDDYARMLLSTEATLDEADLSLLRKYTFKVEEHITEKAFAKLERTFPNVHHDSLKIAKKHVQYLSGLRAGRIRNLPNVLNVMRRDAMTGASHERHSTIFPWFLAYRSCLPIDNMQNKYAIGPISSTMMECSNSRTYYVPLRREWPPQPTRSYDPSQLPLRIHDELMAQAGEVQNASNHAASERLSKEYGIKGVPILSTISSISFPASFPFDFMHLIWENLIPNLILFWTGSFKDLDHQNRGYVIRPDVWKEIGARTAASKTTIPSAFGVPVPNIAQQQGQMTLEMFEQPIYYTHFMRLVQLLKMCLEFEITEEMLDQIDGGFRSWVVDYERLYFSHERDRLSACPLTIHALLHIAWGIRIAGPVWAYWAFPMERHCNTLLPSIRSRRHPYASISAFVTAVAQLDQIKLRFCLQSELDLNPRKNIQSPVLLSDSYPEYKLCPPLRQGPLPVHLRDKFYAALATRFEKAKAVVQNFVTFDEPVTHYGRVVCVGGGDTIVASDMVRRSEDSRDTSYIKYVQIVDRYAHQRNRRPEYVKRSFFGQLQRIIVLNLPPIPQLNIDLPLTVIYAVVQAVKVKLEGSLYYYSTMGATEVIDLSTVQCLIGRVRDGNRWGIIDRSGISTTMVD
ncbi:hypothetical protein AGABI2DRAFT_141379 [Agaricus bisporus var. bisporus H97]|uniref:hypothetical protein n=1 Tax=Agaricus bisporus var. bisporus (strain H97 / ATCC MYA-4626 / FGSC 10389) TaxID=936046 RepID=UPI00029F587A|nr:hypothetical protein AGABI2DRAFT_141379 [Agaricus bisporus var. bisporus H97]EKV50545.1 hypothetical protein AGABI2DRAFT_141379 [Agaricus bisporus var. bisporus H97]